MNWTAIATDMLLLAVVTYTGWWELMLLILLTGRY